MRAAACTKILDEDEFGEVLFVTAEVAACR
jgi:hypothetical protein